MQAQAARRNAAAIRVGRVSLAVASIDDPPDFDGPFDKILAVNNMGMWSEPALRAKELAGLLRGGGRLAVVSQPRCRSATAETTASAASQIAEMLAAAGLVSIRIETLGLEPPVACVIATAATAP